MGVIEAVASKRPTRGEGAAYVNSRYRNAPGVLFFIPPAVNGKRVPNYSNRA
jgi:hypothetical protein